MLVSSLLVLALAIAIAYAGCVVSSVAVSGWMQHAVRVDAPIDAVWEYGSDSTRASEWSVFFDHITPIEGAGRPPDGAVGAFRICYRNRDERGPRWSETTEAVTPLAHREIRTFDVRHFPLGPAARLSEFEVHQDYEALDDAATHLTFRCRAKRPPGFWHLLAFPLVKATYLVFGREAARQVFVWNLENIAEAVAARHAGRDYQRPHPWAPTLAWEAHPIRWWLRDVVAPALRLRPSGA